MELNSFASFQRFFHSKLYDININIDDKKLSLSVKESISGTSWTGDYSTVFIENLTHKAGLEGTSTSVMVDLESHNDLEKIRNRPVQGNSNTIYLILTYIAEFDKVYYPLPLTVLNEKANINTFSNYFQKEFIELSNSLDLVVKEKNKLTEENQKIKQELEFLKNFIHNEQREKEKLKKDFETLKSETNNEIKYLQQSLESLKISDLTKSVSKPILLDAENQEKSKLELENKILKAEIRSLKILNKKRKQKISELNKLLEESKNSLKERSRSVHDSSMETPCRTANTSTRSKSSVKSSCDTSDISAKLERIVNLLAITEKYNKN